MNELFCGMVDWRKAFILISSRDYCQRSSPSRISDTSQAVFEPAQNLGSGLVEWSCAVVITTTPQWKIWFRKKAESSWKVYNEVKTELDTIYDCGAKGIKFGK